MVSLTSTHAVWAPPFRTSPWRRGVGTLTLNSTLNKERWYISGMTNDIPWCDIFASEQSVGVNLQFKLDVFKVQRHSHGHPTRLNDRTDRQAHLCLRPFAVPIHLFIRRPIHIYTILSRSSSYAQIRSLSLTHDTLCTHLRKKNNIVNRTRKYFVIPTTVKRVCSCSQTTED